MTHYCYILESEKGRKYIWSTEDIERRLREHNSENWNTKRFTKRWSQWNLIHVEEFISEKEAHIREKQIKSWKGGRALKNLLHR